MKINSIKLINFRNYSAFEEDFSPSLNIFIGDNAQGKTNLIEAIYMIGTSKSFRANEQDDVIKINENNAFMKAFISKNYIEKEIAFKFIENRRKEIIVNNKKINKSSEYIGSINVTLFSPDDLQIIKGDAANRRRFMDTLLCQTDKVYLYDLINYQRVLKQRNSILKAIKNGEASIDSLHPWDEQLCKYGSSITMARSDLCKSISYLAAKVHKVIKNSEELKIVYKASLMQSGDENEFGSIESFKNRFAQLIKSGKKEELQRGITMNGPHRDDLELSINLLNTRHYGSQGQQRSAAISLKMSEVEYIYQTLNEYPILLLDDIFSELDDKRKEFISSYLNHDIQVFLTGTRRNDFQTLLEKAKIFTIQEGRLNQVEKVKY